MKTKIEIINETIEKIAAQDGQCLNDDGGYDYWVQNKHGQVMMCAVGHHLENPRNKNGQGSAASISVHKKFGATMSGADCGLLYALIRDGKDTSNIDSHYTIDPWLKPEYRGHELSFWYRLQSLHDDHDNWNYGSLTEKGATELAKLMKRYA